MKPADILVALLVVTVWGGNFVAMRTGVLDLPPYLTLTLRMIVAAAALVWFVKWPKDSWGLLFLVAFTMSTLHFGLGLIGIQHVEAGTGAIAMQTSVPFAALIAWLFFREAFGWRRIGGMIISFAGIIIIAGMPKLDGNEIMLGVMIVSAFFFAVASILIKQLKTTDFMSLNGWITILALPQAALASLVLESGQITAIQNAPWQAWAGIAYMALGASIIGQGLWYWLLPRHQTNRIMPFTLLVPVIGVAFGILLLNETLTWQMVVGGGVTIAGVAIILTHRSTPIVRG